MSLDEYNRKRDFGKTPEPSGKKKASRKKNPIFVVQKHQARNLHYDFRLEVGGVLKSWAVPKGPSSDPGEKRLAVPTEDHPLEYASFEGKIPEGQYGAGTVMVWDRGAYLNLRGAKGGPGMEESLRLGKVEVWLEGKKMHGGYVLIRTRIGWLLKKMEDEEADPKHDLTRQDKSAKSGRTMEQIRKAGEKRRTAGKG